MNEVWKPVVGYEGFYKVSSLGRVSSVNRVVVRSDGQKRNFKGKALSLTVGSRGYKMVKLTRNGRGDTFLVHRLVAMAFLKRVPGKDCVNHIDSNRLNNGVQNLEWVTYKENTNHALCYGSISFGEDSHSAKLSNFDIIYIRDFYRRGVYTKLELAKIFNVSRHTIANVAEYRTWKHLP